MSGAPYRALTLAIHPNSRGFSWIAFENPFTIHSFGSVGARGADKNIRCMRRIERLFARLTPESVVLEAFELKGSRRASRITMLGRAIVTTASAESINVAIFGFADVQKNFMHLGARTRHEIAEAVARLFPQLKRYLPQKRRSWESERWRLSLFCTAALAITHYQRDATGVLLELREGG